MSDAIVERLMVVLEGQDSQYQDMLTSAEIGINSFQNSIARAGTILQYITDPLEDFSNTGKEAMLEFDDAMTKSTAIMSGVTEELRDQMEATATSISDRTVTSAENLAEGYYFLASAGMSATDAMMNLDGVNNFAIAGAFDLAQATEMLADSHSALGLRSNDAAENQKQLIRVSDVLVDAANASNASVEQFARSLTTKSAAALRSVNKEIEEGVAVLSVYADQGIKAQNAGEKLTILLRELQTRSAENSAEWNKLGVSVYDSSGNMLHLADIIKQLEGVTAGMSDQQKQAIFTTMGLRAESMDSIKPLIGLSDKIREYEARYKSAGGVTKEVAEKQMTSLSSQLKITANNVENLGREFADLLLPSFIAVNAITLKTVQFFRSLDDSTKTYIATLIQLTLVIGPVLTGFGMLTMLLPQLTAGFDTIRTAITLLTTTMRSGALMAVVPWLPLIAIITLVVASIAGLVYYLVGPDSLAEAWDTVKSYALAFVEGVLGFFANFTTNMERIIGWFKSNWYKLFIDLFKAYIQYNMNMLHNAGVVIQTMLRLWAAFIGWIQVAVPEAFNRIFNQENLVMIIEAIGKLYKYFADFIVYMKQIFADGFVYVGQVFNMFLESMITMTVVFAKKLGSVISMILRGEIPNPAELMQEFAQAAASETAILAVKVAAKTEEIAAGAVEALQAEAEILKKDMIKGASDMNFLNTATDIINEELKNLKGPLDGFKSSVDELPNLVLDRQKEALAASEEAVAAVEGTATVVEEAAEKGTNGLQQMKAAAQSLEGSLRGTTETAAKIEEFLATRKSVAISGDTKVSAKTTTTMIGDVQQQEEVKRHHIRVETLLSEISANTKEQYRPANI